MKTLMVALDGSPRETKVLAGAVALAEKLEAKLLLFRAVGLPHDLPHEALTMSPDALGGWLCQRAEATLNTLAATVPERVRGGVVVTIGNPWHAICDTARARAVDLIVIGSHGYSGIDRLIGTTAAKVVDHADRSVLVIRNAL